LQVQVEDLPVEPYRMAREHPFHGLRQPEHDT
jgi:hypothetical protein